MTSERHATPTLSKRDGLVLGQLTDVHFIARRIHRRLPMFVPFEDLVNAGVLGLLEAAQNYDPTKSIQFKTYARFRVRGAMIDSLREVDSAPRRLRTKGRRLEKTTTALRQRLGRTPTEEEIAAEGGLNIAALRYLTAALDRLRSIDQQVTTGTDLRGSHDLIESAPADSNGSPFAQFQRTEIRQLLAQAVCRLSEREQRVVSLYYVDQLTMSEIAAYLDVSQPRVSQIHCEALSKLRAQFDTKNSYTDYLCADKESHTRSMPSYEYRGRSGRTIRL